MKRTLKLLTEAHLPGVLLENIKPSNHEQKSPKPQAKGNIRKVLSTASAQRGVCSSPNQDFPLL